MKVVPSVPVRLGVPGQTLPTFKHDQYISVRPSLPTYDGAYIVVPSTSEVHLETANKIMADNVTVEEIPTYETHNEAGGITFIIAS